MGGKCIDCGRVHGWVYRQDLFAYSERKARVIFDVSREKYELEQPETIPMNEMNETTSGQAARMLHTGEGYCEKCDTHHMVDGVCKCPAAALHQPKTYEPMPVSGYTPQPAANVALRLEVIGYDGRSIAAARTCINTGGMWAVRSIFQPPRVALSGD